jgi:hypothetical protein
VQLLSAKKIGANRWQAQTSGGSLPLLPFTAIQDERYTTYVKLS